MTQSKQRAAKMLALMAMLSASACAAPVQAAPVAPKPETDLPAPSADETSRTAIFADGCFWGATAAFKQLAGVSSVTSGYCGGTKETATYDDYHKSNHAESVKIVYDPHQVTYATLLQVFFTISEPTKKDGQGPDMGHGYRMAVFYQNDDQKQVAESYIHQLTEAKVYDAPVAVTVEAPGEGFFPAEPYHQDYVAHHPENPYVQQTSIPKAHKVPADFPQLVKSPQPATQP